jgi:hypothetical protein
MSCGQIIDSLNASNPDNWFVECKQSW